MNFVFKNKINIIQNAFSTFVSYSYFKIPDEIMIIKTHKISFS